MNPTANAVPTVYSTTDDIVRNLSLVRDEIADTAAKIDEQQVADLARHLGHPGRVFVAGAGRSGLVLRMAAMRLMHLGLNVHVAGDTTTPAISSGDLLLVASGSGTTSGVVKAAETAAKAGARIAAFTTNPASPLAGLADAVVVIPAAAEDRSRLQRFPPVLRKPLRAGAVPRHGGSLPVAVGQRRCTGRTALAAARQPRITEAFTFHTHRNTP